MIPEVKAAESDSSFLSSAKILPSWSSRPIMFERIAFATEPPIIPNPTIA